MKMNRLNENLIKKSRNMSKLIKVNRMNQYWYLTLVICWYWNNELDPYWTWLVVIFGTKIFDVNIIAAIENTLNESFLSIENPLIWQTLF